MPEPAYPFRIWFWTVTDPVTKRRRRTRHRMTEEEAASQHGADAVKDESDYLDITGPAASTSLGKVP